MSTTTNPKTFSHMAFDVADITAATKRGRAQGRTVGG